MIVNPWQQPAFALVLMCVVAFPALSVWAQEGGVDKAQQLSLLRQRMLAVEKELAAGQLNKTKEEKALRRIEKSLGASRHKIRGLVTKLEQSKLNVRRLQQQQNGLIVGIEGQKNLLVEQLRMVHALGRQHKVKLILNQQDPQRINRIVQYYDFFNQARVEKVEALEVSVNKLDAVELKLRQEQSQLAGYMKKSKAEGLALKKAKGQRKNVLVVLQAKVKSSGKELIVLKEDEKALNKLLRKIKQATQDIPFGLAQELPFTQQKGKLAWPIKGVLQKKFGSIRPSGRWDGVLISSKAGASIRSVAHGRVVFADWLRGYGLLLIVDHGEGYLSLYAFNESLYKEVGDWASGGEVVAAAGTSGGQSKAGLYFSIRKNGKPVNPVHWCRAVNKGRVG